MKKMIEYEEIALEAEHEKKTRPKTIVEWKGRGASLAAKMVRVHSLKATVNEIISTIENSLDVVKIGIIGEPSTGKSTLADTLAHLIHIEAKIPFAVRSFGEEEFLDFERTLSLLEPANYILKFRDLSFLTGKYGSKQIDLLKQQMTKIRHLPGGKDVKIILIYDYHYTLGLDKYLRQANFRYFTSIGSSEKENMINIVGTGYTSVINDFMAKYVEMTTQQKATFKVGANNYFIYNYKNPFVPCLFFNNARLRYTIFPKREWIDKICSICSFADNPLLSSQVSVDEFKKQTEQKFGGDPTKTAVKHILLMNGINTFGATVVQCRRYIERALALKIISLDELARIYGLTETRTKLRKKLDGVLLDN